MNGHQPRVSSRQPQKEATPSVLPKRPNRSFGLDAIIRHDRDYIKSLVEQCTKMSEQYLTEFVLKGALRNAAVIVNIQEAVGIKSYLVPLTAFPSPTQTQAISGVSSEHSQGMGVSEPPPNQEEEMKTKAQAQAFGGAQTAPTARKYVDQCRPDELIVLNFRDREEVSRFIKLTITDYPDLDSRPVAASLVVLREEEGRWLQHAKKLGFVVSSSAMGTTEGMSREEYASLMERKPKPGNGPVAKMNREEKQALLREMRQQTVARG